MSRRFFTAMEWRKAFAALPEGERERRQKLADRFVQTFGDKPFGLFSAPGRTEIGGNHTDHENGCVLAAAVNLDTIAAVAENGSTMIRLHSDGYRPCLVDLSNLSAPIQEKNTTNALIRGVAAAFAKRGAKVRGFDMVMTSNVLPGSGLSSSAAVEVLLGVVMNTLFFGGKATPVEIAQIGQFAENVYFGKPSGLMDQTASSVGGLVTIDFADTKNPIVKPVAFDFAKTGYHLCILDSGASHANLTGEYTAIVSELRAVCKVFGKTVLGEVPEADFWARLPEVRAACGDRAALRAMHIYADNARVKQQVAALEQGDFDAFLALVRESGQSSLNLLQNVTPSGATAHQELALTIALGEKLLGKRGACRVHGGGFAGTAQAFVPDDLLTDFVQKTEAVLGKGHCHVLSIRQDGGIQL
ncbi:MAG: galactokinase [Oscillospiraceae bacterium]|nr:galactokinase [Oscillospiraceae bacterium]